MKKATIRDRLQTNKGFILAEVVLAISIISIALVAISGMFIQAIHTDLMANHTTVAANLAQKQLELLKTYPPEYWAALTFPCIIPWQDNAQILSSEYTLITNAYISAVDDHVVEVIVTVSWQEPKIECNIQFVTLFPTL